MEHISPEEALAHIARVATPRPPRSIAVEHATGHVLSDVHHARFDVPSFPQSAMDGWAVRAEDVPGRLRIQGELRATAHDALPDLSPGQTLRIFTGAPIPGGANAIVRQEHALREGDIVTFEREVDAGQDIRPAGELLGEGALLAEAGTLVTPAVAAALASQGVDRVEVQDAPIVWLRTGGDEIIAPGQPLRPGQLYDSNHALLRGLLQELGCRDVRHARLADDVDALAQGLDEVREGLIVTVGGVSVGDYDCVRATMRALGYAMVFEGVRQRLGKPMCLARHPGGALWLGLPGNPSAAFLTATIYLRAILTGFGVCAPRAWRSLSASAPDPRGLDRFTPVGATGEPLADVPRALLPARAEALLWTRADGTRWLS